MQIDNIHISSSNGFMYMVMQEAKQVELREMLQFRIQLFWRHISGNGSKILLATHVLCLPYT